MIVQKIRIKTFTGVTLYFSLGSIFPGMDLFLYSPLPSDLDNNTVYAGPYIFSLDVGSAVPVTVVGSFTTGATSPPTLDAQLIVEFVNDLTEPIDSCNNSESINLVWINREGGRSSYIFDQRKDFGITVGNEKTFDNNGVIKYVSRGKQFENKTVYKKGLSKNEVDFLDSLRYSIQAWEYDAVNDISTPIVLDSNSFDKYNTKENLFEISFKYRLATYKEVQNQ